MDPSTRPELTDSVAKALDKCIAEAMYEAYHARERDESQILVDIRALGFQHPPELFAWVKEIFAAQRAAIVRTPGADPTAPLTLQLRRGLYPHAPGACIECGDTANINMPANDPLYSICIMCMRRKGVPQATTTYEVWNGRAPHDSFTEVVEPMIFKPKKSNLARDESFLTGTSLAGKHTKTLKKKK